MLWVEWILCPGGWWCLISESGRWDPHFKIFLQVLEIIGTLKAWCFVGLPGGWVLGHRSPRQHTSFPGRPTDVVSPVRPGRFHGTQSNSSTQAQHNKRSTTALRGDQVMGVIYYKPNQTKPNQTNWSWNGRTLRTSQSWSLHFDDQFPHGMWHDATCPFVPGTGKMCFFLDPFMSFRCVSCRFASLPALPKKLAALAQSLDNTQFWPSNAWLLHHP